MKKNVRNELIKYLVIFLISIPIGSLLLQLGREGPVYVNARNEQVDPVGLVGLCCMGLPFFAVLYYARVYFFPLSFEPKMVYVPDGPFMMGAESGDNISPHETPYHEVSLPAFSIGQYPITNKQYAEFIRQTNHPVWQEMGWFSRTPPSEKLNHPVVGVSYLDALSYCRWLCEVTGKAYRLPTEAEWEKAARGPDGFYYPWGDEWKKDYCHYNQTDTTQVNSHPNGVSFYGCEDMLGNAAEWTTTLWGTDPTKTMSTSRYYVDQREDTTTSGYRIYRGGSYRDDPHLLRCSARSWSAPDYRTKWLGFRVAMSVGK